MAKPTPEPISVGSTFHVTPTLSVVCFSREGNPLPYFAVREFDTKILRTPSKHKKLGSSEQAIRASIRQTILNMNLKSEPASKNEIRQLKTVGILGKRAPSCSLLSADDMLRLLEAFHKDSYAKDLRNALKGLNLDTLIPLPPIPVKTRARSRRPRSTDKTPKPKRRKIVSTSGLDALLSALEKDGELQPDSDDNLEVSQFDPYHSPVRPTAVKAEAIASLAQQQYHTPTPTYTPKSVPYPDYSAYYYPSQPYTASPMHTHSAYSTAPMPTILATTLSPSTAAVPAMVVAQTSNALPLPTGVYASPVLAAPVYATLDIPTQTSAPVTPERVAAPASAVSVSVSSAVPASV